jgi:hypothetical protein
MAPTGVFQASSEEQGSHEVPSIFNVGPNSNAIEPISRKATLTVANQCQLPEDTTTTDTSYRLVPVGVPSTDPDLISVKDHQPSDRTAVNPECGITYLADQQIQRNIAFIKTLWDPLIRRPEDLQYDFQMPHSDSERLGMYYALVQRLVALEIEIGLLDDVVFSLPIPPQSMTKLPALPRFNFYSKQLGQPMIMGPPATCDFHKGPGPEFITEKTFQSLGAYCIWLEYARDGVNKRIAELRLSVMKQLKIARDDVSH